MDSPNLKSATYSPNLHSLGGRKHKLPKETSSESGCSPCESAYSKATRTLATLNTESHSYDDDQSDNVNASARPSMKRKRAAQVHQLSEKRSRDQINKRLRALRSLIPNCTKMDKASVLDEAIEYLKSLQLQLQIMSFFSGLCVPPTQMILPTQYPIIGTSAIDLRLGAGALQLFGLPFAGYGTRFQIPLPMNELLRRSAQQP